MVSLAPQGGEEGTGPNPPIAFLPTTDFNLSRGPPLQHTPAPGEEP